jgi:hypothetical protein
MPSGKINDFNLNGIFGMDRPLNTLNRRSHHVPAACLGQRVSVIGLVMTNEDGLFRRRYTIRMAGRFIVCAGTRLTWFRSRTRGVWCSGNWRCPQQGFKCSLSLRRVRVRLAMSAWRKQCMRRADEQRGEKHVAGAIRCGFTPPGVGTVRGANICRFGNKIQHSKEYIRKNGRRSNN